MAVTKSTTARRTTARKTVAKKAAPAKRAPAKKTTTSREPDYKLTPADYKKVAGALDTLTALLGTGTPAESADAEEREPLDREEVAEMGIKELRELAEELELGTRVKAEILEALEDGGFYGDDDEDEDEDEDDEGEADEEDDDEDEDEEEEGEEGEYSREDLEEMTLAQVKKIAKEEYEVPAADLRGLDQDAIIDLLVGEDEEGDEEDEDEDGDDLTEADLKKMDLAELKAVAKDLKLKVPVAVAKNKTKLINLIMEQAEEE